MKTAARKISMPLMFSVLILAVSPKEAKAFGALEGALIGAGIGALVGIVMAVFKKKPPESPAAPLEKSASPQDSVKAEPGRMPADSAAQK